MLEYAHERLVRGSVLAAALLVTAGAQVGRGSTSAATALADVVLSFCFPRTVHDLLECLERSPVRAGNDQLLPGRVEVDSESRADKPIHIFHFAELVAVP